MKNHIRRVLALVIAISAAPLFAASVDFGGNLLNSSGLGNYPSIGSAAVGPGLFQRDLANVWFQAAMTDSLLFSFQAGGAFSLAPYPQPSQSYYGDVDLFSLQGEFPTPQAGLSLYRFTLGRTFFSDFTGLVFNQKADGLSFGFEFPAASVSVSAAYTGLVIKGASTISLSKADQSDLSNPAVFFASPRVVEILRVSFPSLLGQNLVFSGVFQEDLRGTSILDAPIFGRTGILAAGSTEFSTTKGGPVNTQYFGLGLDGQIAGPFYYKLYGYFQTGQDLVFTSGSYQSTLSLAYLGGGELRCFLPTVLFSNIGAKFIYVSGDPTATTVVEGHTPEQQLSLFTPITRSTAGWVFSPQLSNVMYAEASYSLKPLAFLGADGANALQAVAQADVYLRSTRGAISESGIPATISDPEIPTTINDLYLGTEADLTVNFRPFSDVGITFWGGAFLPGSVFGANPALQYKSGLDVSISF
jgi:hypothetical protein